MPDFPLPPPTAGVVTFLDVLGWKGVYDRKPDAIESLSELVEGLRTEAELLSGNLTGEVVIKSISDTIAIFTLCPEQEASTAIDAHGELCAWVIPRSIISEIPVRGATTFGDFELGENIFVGKAIDEAAAWHEQTDWMGVHLTPSAEYVFNPASGQRTWIRYTPPHKARLDWTPHCVDWTNKWRNRAYEISSLKLKFRRLGPIMPEIAGKFVNTLKFVEHVQHTE
jgi:hypothetical protein